MGIVGLSGCGLVENVRLSSVFRLTSLLTRLQIGLSTDRLKSAMTRLPSSAMGITCAVLKYLLHTMRAPIIPVTVGFPVLLSSVRRLGARPTP